ncbi:hypothetical protein BOX15_Mlig004681g2 [Macrostomum lignano]|uniref:Uncharacterized protein n=2 Tax=Macrostomum lignano TaxID=282301 RepID=A0A267DHT1_9PLAT|nr:hypothetical protein BOX15_Mlig004681g2 [Macrostomum lignano]
MATQPGIVLLVISLSAAGIWQPASSERANRCAYPQVQQMFDLAKYGLSGCYKLKSLTVIFGDSKSTRDTLVAARYLTANLVFIGTVSHVIKDASSGGGKFKIKVQVDCYLRGRLNREEVEVTGLNSGFGTGLCLDIKCEDGDSGLFFVTYTDGELRINENGFVRKGPELDFVMKTLRCRENRDSVSVWPTASRPGQAKNPQCEARPADPLAEPTCQMSLATARQYLDLSFIHFESDLKPECQEGKDFVMRQLIKTPVEPKVSYSFMYGKGGSRVRPMTLPAAAAAVVSIFSLMWLARCH